MNCYSIEMGIALISSLSEFVQGPCRQNQSTLVQSKTIDCCRDLLQKGQDSTSFMKKRGFVGERADNLDEIKDCSVGLLLSIIEGQNDKQIYERVGASLDNLKIVTMRMNLVYQNYVTHNLGLAKDDPPWKIQAAVKD